jgi:hypothetical protein
MGCRWSHLRLWLIALVPPAFWLANLWLAREHRQIFLAFTAEDGWIENAQFVLFCVASVLSFKIYRCLRRDGVFPWALIYSVLAVLLGWVAGEEISWGQRIFGMETPEIFADNRQGEMNLHNLPGVMDGISEIANIVIITTIGLALVLGWYARSSIPVMWRPQLWVPHPSLIPALLCYLSFKAARQFYFVGGGGKLISRLQEPAELILIAAVVVFLLMVLSNAQSESVESDAVHRAMQRMGPIPGSGAD